MTEVLLRLFQSQSTVSVALLFGSCALDAQIFDSDIDIAVLSDGPMNAVRLKGTDNDMAKLYVRNVLEVADFMPFVTRALKERQQAWTK
jgi:predicted nucleotidyltransferase